MKKIRKGKKMLITLLALVLIVLAVVLIVNIVNKKPEEPETPTESNPVFILPETTYSDMQVKNIVMEYLRDNDETMVTMEIHNTTTKKVENEFFTAVLISADEEVLGQRELAWIDELDVGEYCEVQVILKGDLTATTHIKLIEK